MNLAALTHKYATLMPNSQNRHFVTKRRHFVTCTVLLLYIDASSSHGIGLDGRQFQLHVELRILIADAGTVEIEVHAARFAYQRQQACRGISLRDYFLITSIKSKYMYRVLNGDFILELTASCSSSLKR